MTAVNGVGEPKMEAHVYKYKWLALGNGVNGSPVGAGSSGAPGNVDLAVYADKSVQVTGTFGAAGSVSIQGSNDGGTTFATMNDANGNALTFTSGAIKQITENPEQIQPIVTAGDGTTSLNVYLYMRKLVV